ncbi:MAG TPA: hypothetical protein VGI40_00340 [Pirellulaceae bacterium]
MIRTFARIALIGILFQSITTAGAADRASVLVVVGAAGEKDFGEQFAEWAKRWRAAADKAQADVAVIGLDDSESQTDRELLQQRLGTWTEPSAEAAWLVFIGHGTFDGKTAKFSLRGPDITPSELAGWLKPIERQVAVIDCTSASGPFLNELSAKNRVVITAARSGSEYNYSRFGDYFSTAITDPKADLDKDDQTSLLEAFLLASSAVKEFYAGEGRLATEHALIDDNGDGLGTPADWFQGLRATKAAKDGAPLDGFRAGQIVLIRSAREQQLPAAVRARRDELERDLVELRQRKPKLAEDEYLSQIEPILVELAKLYDAAERAK